MISDGTFRGDLYYRLSVLALYLPPLRKRREDIMELAGEFIRQFNRSYNKNIRGISDEAKGILLRHSWPGNVRELKNCIERSVIFADGDKVQKEDLPSQYREFEGVNISEIDSLLKVLTREQILEALEKAGGVKYKAAEILKIHRKTLYNQMKNLGID
jgi:transcriptional regulator with PAS, ATPase and Fis domain